MHTNRIRICLFSITKRITNYKGDRPITWVMSELSKRTAELLDASAARLFEGRDVAVAFSGGIDSGIVAALAVRHASSVRLYTAGTEGSHDIAAAREIAPQIGAELSEIAVRESDIPDILREVMRLTGSDSPMMLSFELPLFCVLRSCGEGFVAGGQGSDEQFGGYSKYAGKGAAAMREEMAADMGRLFRETRPAEARMAQGFGKEILCPYLDRDLVAFMRSAPDSEILPTAEGERKMLLSAAARDLGLPFLADRPKKAAQYGSGTMDAVRRICKKRGITFSQLVSQLRKDLDG